MASASVMSNATAGAPHAKADDATLVGRARAGDTQAFAELVERHERVVLRVAIRVAGRDEGPDVAQEAFMRSFHRLSQYRGDSAFRSWLLGITYNTALDALRRRPAPAPESAPEPVDAAEREPAMRLEERERRERLEAKLAMLKPEHRAVLVLRDIEGMRYEEIAQATTMPIGSVKGRLHRARAELIELLRSNTYDWDLPDE